MFEVNTKALAAVADQIRSNDMIADTGCDVSFLPDSYRKYCVEPESGPRYRVQLGGKGNFVNASRMATVKLRVKAEDGSIRDMYEKCVFSKENQYPLLGCMYRSCIFTEGIQKVEVEGKDGEKFWAVVDRSRQLPLLVVLNDVEEICSNVAVKAIDSNNTLDINNKYLRDISTSKASSWSQQQRQQILLHLHHRFGHATCRKLYLTLEEHGIGGVFTDKECREIKCDVCNLLNRKKGRIERVSDPLRNDRNVSEVAYQDLAKMPKGFDGSLYFSTIIDARSRFISLMNMKTKDQAFTHAVAYVRKVEQDGRKVKEWKSDNGREFKNEDFEEFLRKEGIVQNFGAPYTPESQGLVERANGTVKKLIGKILRMTGIPISTWPALLPGVVQQINSIVHSTTEKSPYKESGNSKAGRMPDVVVGDIVSVVEPSTRSVFEGIYGGQYNDQNASVIILTSNNRWRVLRVHPTAIRFRALQGSRKPQAGGNPMQNIEKSTDIESSSSDDYDNYDQVYCELDDQDSSNTSNENADQDDDDDIEYFIDGNDDGNEDSNAYISKALRGQYVDNLMKPRENKAKNQIEATKEEIAAGSHREADMKELKSYFDNKALGPRVENVTPDILKKTFDANWRRTFKGYGDDRVAKSRLYVQGFRDRRVRGWLETFAGTADPGLERMLYLYALNHHWKAAKADVKTAYLQSCSEAELYARLPKNLPSEAAEFGYVAGGIYLMLAAIYGMKDSARIFGELLQNILIEKMKFVEVAESLFCKYDSKCNPTAFIRKHSDDTRVFAPDPNVIIDELRQHLKMGETISFKRDEWVVYTGIEMKWDDEKGEAYESQQQYASEVDTQLKDAERRRKFGVKDLEPSREEDININFQKAQQSWTGVLGWLARTVRNISVVFSEISKNSTKPSALSVLNARRACEYAKSICVPLKFEKVSDPCVIFWVDANFNVNKCEGRLGFELQVINKDEFDYRKISITKESNVIAWRSHKCNRKLASSSGAELCALVEVVKLAPLYVSLVSKIWKQDPRVIILTDSQPVLDWLRNRYVKADPALQGMLDLARERIDDLKAEVFYIDTKNNRADKHTKFIHV